MSNVHWVDEIAEFSLADQECFFRRVKCETQEVSPSVWKHTFTPLPASPKLWVEADPFFDNPRANCALARMMQRKVSQHRRELRTRQRTRRQHRATFRRRKRGLA